MKNKNHDPKKNARVIRSSVLSISLLSSNVKYM